ncbi:MAG: Ig-like domain-containing protein [Natrialbaceae archaeon]|nr:Ig-like domain-containing protein [Natrialbaceae archaeon]
MLAPNETVDVTENATLTSSNTSVATVGANGTVTGISAGTATIEAAYQNDTSTRNLSVIPAVESVSLTIADELVGQTRTTSAVVNATYTNGTTLSVTNGTSFASADSSIASVTDDGIITGQSRGTTAISASFEGQTVDESVTTGVLLEIPNTGDYYSVGFPLPVVQTLGETFVNETEGIGAVFSYDGGWKLRTDLSTMSLGTRDAVVLTTTGSGPATIPLVMEYEDGSSGIGQPSPGLRRVSSGWNFISAANCEDAQSSFLRNPIEVLPENQEVPRVVTDQFKGPTSPMRSPVNRFSHYILGSYQWGTDPPSVDPLKGYFALYTESVDILALENPDNLCSG